MLLVDPSIVSTHRPTSPYIHSTIGANMAIDVSTLSAKQLRDLIRKARGRMKNIDKEKIAKVKTKINAVLKSEGVTFAQVYGKKRGGKGKVAPKYRNPAGSETWSGRGKRPRWFLAALKSGKKEKDLLIK
ncbi:MAG: H-NS family nucleoid-associated regulatory protein [Rhodanobacteraceae bacterium]